MTTISIVPEPLSAPGSEYRAMAGKRQSVGRSPGEALDALSAQLPESESGTLLVVQQMRPDRFFSADLQMRLSVLMNAWREARDRGREFPAEDQAELERLVETELEASTLRAQELSKHSRR